jgi:hypothetical protein
MPWWQVTQFLEELHNLYSSSNIIMVIKTRKMRLAEHVACMGEMRNAYRILNVEYEGRDYMGDIGIVRG